MVAAVCIRKLRRVRIEARLEPELSLSAIFAAGQARTETERLAARENHRHGEQPLVEVAALRFHVDGRGSRFHRMRSNHQDSLGTDGFH